MISKIGFKNFRRFKEYTEVELGDINMFVGGNNAGKSTVVKALLLVANFLKNTKVTSRSAYETPRFYFDTQFVNIDTFRRAKNWDSVKDDELSFNIVIDNFEITIGLFDNIDQNLPYAEVKYININDYENDCEFKFHLGVGTAKISLGSGKKLESTPYEELAKKREELLRELYALEKTLHGNFDTVPVGGDITEIMSTMVTTKEELSAIDKEIAEESLNVKSTNVSIKLPKYNGNIGMILVASLIQNIIDYAEVDNVDAFTEKGKKNQNILRPYVGNIKASVKALEKSLSEINVEYIYAHAASQKVQFNIKDNNDYLSQSIKQLHDLKITALSTIGKDMKVWLKDFVNIDSFKLAPISAIVKSTKDSVKEYTVGSGEGIAFAVKYHGQWHDLGDMGRGTIQLVSLFINLAIILKKYEKETVKPLVIVEEPEQNLHPAKQAELANLFIKVCNDKRMSILIETHSEYMIRRFQVIVADKIYNNNISVDDINKDYKVFYFTQLGHIKDMTFRENAKFEDTFDEGFFDQANRDSIKLSYLERENNKKGC